MFKITLPFFTTPTLPRRYAATLNMGLFTPQYQPIPMVKTQNITQQVIENKLAHPEEYELKKVLFPKNVIEGLKEELLSPGMSAY